MKSCIGMNMHFNDVICLCDVLFHVQKLGYVLWPMFDYHAYLYALSPSTLDDVLGDAMIRCMLGFVMWWYAWLDVC